MPAAGVTLSPVPVIAVAPVLVPVLCLVIGAKVAGSAISGLTS